jgi:IS605 OrfB family transposase
LVLYVLFEDFEGGSTHGAKEETATPKSSLMTTPIDRTELVEQSGCPPALVDYAAKHRRTIVLEKLENVCRGRIRHYAEKSQWSFYQLLPYILYKAALRGVLVLEVDSAYTGQECSRCHQVSKPNGKSFRCGYCGHRDHRDAHAAFPLAERVSPIGQVAQESECLRSALVVEPFLGTEVQQCA